MNENKRPKPEWENFGQAVKEVSIAIVAVGLLCVVVVGLFIIGNVVLGLD